MKDQQSGPCLPMTASQCIEACIQIMSLLNVPDSYDIEAAEKEAIIPNPQY